MVSIELTVDKLKGVTVCCRLQTGQKRKYHALALCTDHPLVGLSEDSEFAAHGGTRR